MDVSADYQKIARALVQVADGDFDEVKLEAKIEDDWSEKVYRRKAEGVWSKGLRSPADVDFEVDDALDHIRETMTQPGQKPWSRCTFILMPDGKFKFDVDYDD